MKHMKLVIAALALVVAMFAAFAGPAMAQDLNCQDVWGNWISCDGTYYAPVDTSTYNPYGYYNDNYGNRDLFGSWGLFRPCGLFGTYDAYTGMCY